MLQLFIGIVVGVLASPVWTGLWDAIFGGTGG